MISPSGNELENSARHDGMMKFVLLLGLVGCFSAGAQNTGTIRDVRHVVIFMQENRSFDHYYGFMKGVRGFDDRNALAFQNGSSDLYQPTGNGYLLPFHFGGPCVVDLAHDWGSGHTAWNFGKWDQWVAAKGTTSLAYYTRADLPFHYGLADAYTICDAYHCSVLGPSNPNRLYLWTGMIDPRGTGGGPIIDNSEPASGFTWTTYPERLQNAGIDWKVYQEIDNFDDNALAWFAQYKNAAPGNPLYDRGIDYVNDLVTAFKADVSSGTLPRVSWLIAPTALSEHPSDSPASGAALTKQLLDALASNPAVLNSTVFILTFDENDGFFDHVPPPVPFPGTDDEFVNGLPIGLGVRVPTVIVSPWTRGGHVCSQVFDHTSILRFLETWTGVQEPNISAWRRLVCGDLTSAFDFANPDYSHPSLPGVTAVSCGGGVIPAVPATQTVPVQEPGAKPARPLPYQPNANSYTDCSNGLFYIIMTNSGTESGHFAIYPNAYRTDRPAQFDVGPGSSMSDAYDVITYGGGNYDLTCYGPNGFQRRFAGNINSACGQIEVTSKIDLSVGGLAMVMRNSTVSAVTFTVAANAYETDGPWTYVLPGGSTMTRVFPVVTNSNGWYDLTATASSDGGFLRRFAGHVESRPLPPQLLFVVSNGNIVLTWPGAPTIRLQQTLDLNLSVWTDVSGTLGASSAPVAMTNSTACFRLAQ